jgi:hypothetical protein
MTIRAIHPFGPAPGEYTPGAHTDIRATIAKARSRLARRAATTETRRHSATCLFAGSEIDGTEVCPCTVVVAEAQS